jgi:hypothetical protein
LYNPRAPGKEKYASPKTKILEKMTTNQPKPASEEKNERAINLTPVENHEDEVVENQDGGGEEVVEKKEEENNKKIDTDNENPLE